MTQRETRSTNLNLRIRPQDRALISRAAEAENKTVSEFVTAAARREAEDVLLDKTHFVLDEERFAAFVEAIDSPPEENSGLDNLFSRKPIWER